MATYDQLMVYKTSYDLTVEVMRLSKKLPRELRFTLGERVINSTVEMMISIYRVNIEQANKFDKLGIAREELETLRLLVRIIKDLQYVSVAYFTTLSEMIESISKQLTAWQRSVRVPVSKGTGSAPSLFQ